MVEWTFVNTETINKIGYNKELQSLYIDFIGSETDTAFKKVPESIFRNLIEAKYPDHFFRQVINSNYEIAIR